MIMMDQSEIRYELILKIVLIKIKTNIDSI